MAGTSSRAWNIIKFGWISRISGHDLIKQDRMDPWINYKKSAVYNFGPTVMKFCVMWEGQALPHDTKLHNCGAKIIDSRVFSVDF